MFQIHNHSSGFTSLHEQIPKEVLPTEYGGEAGSIRENWGISDKVLNYMVLDIQNSIL
jgi:hypothetical protein